MKRVLVTGGTGFIGSHLVEALLKERIAVRCLVRDTNRLNWLEHVNTEFVRADLADYDSLERVVSGVDTIFHLAGKTVSATEEEFYIANAKGTMNLLKAAFQNNPGLRRFVYVSSLAAVGPSPRDEPMSEDHIPNPLSPYGASKLAGEEAVLTFHPQIPITIVRPPIVYGPRDTAIFNFFRTIDKGIKPVLGWRTRFGSFIYVEDLVRGLMLAADNEKAVGKTYFLVTDSRVPYKDLNRAIAKALGKKAVTFHVPVFGVMMSVLFHEVFHRGKKSNLITWHKLRELQQRFWICDGSKVQQELGFQPEFSLKEGMEKSAAWYKQVGWL